MEIFLHIKDLLNELNITIQSVEDQDYVSIFNNENATLGKHIRHSIELFQMLLESYDEGAVNYDQRKRDIRIETDRNYASKCIEKLHNDFERPDKAMNLLVNNQNIPSSYLRELWYQAEHIIHHNAIIKPILQKLQIQLDDNFGVAQSTIKYRSNVFS